MNLNLSTEEAKVGEAVTSRVKVSNVGREKGTYAVTLKIDGSPYKEKKVTLEPDESTTVPFEFEKQETGTFTISVGEISRRLEIRQPEPGKVLVKDMSVSPKEVKTGEPITVSVQIKNPGETEASRTLKLEVNGEQEKAREVSLKPGSSSSIEFDVRKETEGSYLIKVGSATSSFEVVKPEKEIKVVASFSAPGMGLAWDGTYLWSADKDKEKIYKLDPSTGEVVFSFSVHGMRDPRGLAWDGTHLWNTTSEIAYQYDPSTGEVISSFDSKLPVIPKGLAWDGSYLCVVANEAGSIRKVDPQTEKVVSSLELSRSDAGSIAPSSWVAGYRGPTGLAWDGSHFWIANDNTDKIYKLDPSSGEVISSFDWPARLGRPYGLAWDGSYLWCVGYEIYKIDVKP
ncbi:hypothetical protein AKJ66_01885 [candidate division MSBL1 archaeon SCGC-AAA259E22]|uniref:CARDB domain-containing protein n=1 Tax=candidate division MSBL1 archaeon SCGC-AAA259E22 TaxID=1698265 RepID=A0A133UH57_9EURY|nr:hypothetical protein AKJ66_01885 [candidate division MSBL1 archaeon SCGC-AAA259E22]